MPNENREPAIRRTRRAFLTDTATGLGAVALSALLDPQWAAGAPEKDKWKGVVNPLHHPAKAQTRHLADDGRRASHLETFDCKPKLAEMHGKPMPESMTKGQQLAQLQGQKLRLLRTAVAQFKQDGSRGRRDLRTVSTHRRRRRRDLLHPLDDHRRHQPRSGPHVHEHRLADCRSALDGRVGQYGLGSETEDLPGFVVLTSLGQGGQNQPIAARQWCGRFSAQPFPRRATARQRRSGLVSEQPHGRLPRTAGRRGPGRSTSSTGAATPW